MDKIWKDNLNRNQLNGEYGNTIPRQKAGSQHLSQETVCNITDNQKMDILNLRVWCARGIQYHQCSILCKKILYLNLNMNK